MKIGNARRRRSLQREADPVDAGVERNHPGQGSLLEGCIDPNSLQAAAAGCWQLSE